MRMRRYCVTVMDNWTPTRVFWTFGGALRWWVRNRPVSFLFVWDKGRPQSTAKPEWRQINIAAGK